MTIASLRVENGQPRNALRLEFSPYAPPPPFVIEMSPRRGALRRRRLSLWVRCASNAGGGEDRWVAGAGFTLIEVLVALAIVSIALLAALRAAGLGTTNADELRSRLLAGWVAENVLAEHRARGDWLPLGIQRGAGRQGGVDFAWREEVTALPNPAFRRVDVLVYAVPRRVARAGAPDGLHDAAAGFGRAGTLMKPLQPARRSPPGFTLIELLTALLILSLLGADVVSRPARGARRARARRPGNGQVAARRAFLARFEQDVQLAAPRPARSAGARSRRGWRRSEGVLEPRARVQPLCPGARAPRRRAVSPTVSTSGRRSSSWSGRASTPRRACRPTRHRLLGGVARFELHYLDPRPRRGSTPGPPRSGPSAAARRARAHRAR